MLRIKAHRALRGISQLQTATIWEVQNITVIVLHVLKASGAVTATGCKGGDRAMREAGEVQQWPLWEMMGREGNIHQQCCWAKTEQTFRGRGM